MAYQFWKELCDKDICIFSSVAVYNYQQAKQKQDERKDNQREQLIERSAKGWGVGGGALSLHGVQVQR